MYISVILVAIAALARTSWTLTGPHVCHRVVNYTVTSREQYEEPVEILTLAWCLQIPPRCPVTRTELRQRWRMKSDMRFKTVPACCEGYVMQDLVGTGSADAKCVPHCERCPASRGTCTAPNECTCEPGFQGQDCGVECPQGSWGKNCENECNCLSDLACNPQSGKCDCPAGWTGPRCESKCPEGQWGQSCSSICVCDNPQAVCHHETGECPPSVEPPGKPANIDLFEASGNLVPSKSPDFVIDFDTRDSIDTGLVDRPYESVTAPVPSLPDDLIPVSTTRRTEGTQPTKVDAEVSPGRTTVPATSTTSTTEGNQLSQPELDRDFDEQQRGDNFRVIVSPKTEYVKTSQKDEGATMATIPIDVAAMIVVGALVCIGLTSVAAIMIFHVRSRLLKVALSIYNQEKLERQCVQEKSDLVHHQSIKSSTSDLNVTIGTLPRGTMTRHNPMYANAGLETNGGPPLLTLDDRPVEYANGTVTIGIRLSSNLRDLLESHYDRPAPIAQPEDHVYDEIPLAAPLYKYTT